MRRVGLFCLSLVTVCMFGIVIASAASAVALPEYTVAASAKSTIGKILYVTEGGTKLECAKGTEEFSPSSTSPKKSGTFTVDFQECKTGGETCHSLGSSAGAILAGGEWRLVRGKSEEALIWYILSHELHVECKFFATLLLIAGSALGVITPLLELTFNCGNALLIKEGKQAVTEYENNSGEKVKVSATVSINGGARQAIAVSAEEYKIHSEKETEIIDTK